MTDVLALAVQVATALEACGLPYLIGGSLASSIMGEPRSTLDLDFVVALSPPQVLALASALGAEFYFDVEQAQAAAHAGSSCNAIHEPSGIKVDFFVVHSALDQRQMQRRRRVEVGPARDPLFVYTPEDILLQKLRWYRMGGEISDRQWRDVLGIIQTQAERLDRAYVMREAALLQLTELAQRAFAASR